ncbi:hypothetical protein HXX76_012158 [Chlamydomonas incerta]|uniref:Uncharacterized protein n=1 Tax=Chlamydomonas incerta TaxID=51695 RepID=A0A835SIK4_CHLIN|nr:hypothetical protein HXX76_012158 [Chlamydomonas incerta]|eukprot:KAG2427837.1 hypothetical protein HXX76_012158 [Chlamydomonas incerta]
MPTPAAPLELRPLPSLSPLPPMLAELPACVPLWCQEPAGAAAGFAFTAAEEGGSGVQSEPATPTAHCGVLAEMEQQKMRFRSVDAGMTALESISKTLRQRGPSLYLTKQPVLKYPLYPRSLALAAAAAAGVTNREADHLGTALAGGSLEAHVQLQTRAREQQLEEAYQQLCWKPARRSTVMRRVNAVALSLPPAWTGPAEAGGLQQQGEEEPSRPRRSTPVWERLSRTPTPSNSGAAGSQPPSRGGASSVSAQPAPAAAPGRRGNQPGTQLLLVRGKERTAKSPTLGAARGAAQRGGRAGSPQKHTTLPALAPQQQRAPAQVQAGALGTPPSTPPPHQQHELGTLSMLFADAAAGAPVHLVPSAPMATWDTRLAAPKSRRGTELLMQFAGGGGGGSGWHQHQGPPSVARVGGGGRVSRVHVEAPPPGHMPAAGSTPRISLILSVYQGGGR